MKNHYPYFEGRGDDVWPTKSVKTMCGKRVARGGAELDAPIECEDCRAVLQKSIDNARHIAIEVRKGTPGYTIGAEHDQKLVTACDRDAARLSALLERAS